MANEELLRKEAECRAEFLSARDERTLAQDKCTHALNKLQSANRELYAAGFTGNIMRDENGERVNTRPAAPVEGLETVGWLWEYAQYRTDDRGYYGYETVITENNPTEHVRPAEKLRNVRELVTRSQSEAIIAAERAENDEAYELGKRDGYSEAVQEIDLKTGGDGEYRYCTDRDPERHTPDPESMIQRIVERFETLNTMESISEIKEWKRRANEAEADNAALTARVKELEKDVAKREEHRGKLMKGYRALETQLAAAKDALEIVANAHASNPSLAMADVPEADYVRHVLYEMRKLARAALEAKP